MYLKNIFQLLFLHFTNGQTKLSMADQEKEGHVIDEGIIGGMGCSFYAHVITKL